MPEILILIHDHRFLINRIKIRIELLLTKNSILTKEIQIFPF